MTKTLAALVAAFAIVLTSAPTASTAAAGGDWTTHLVAQHRLQQRGAVCVKQRRYLRVVDRQIVGHTRWQLRKSAEIKCGVPF